MEISGSANKSWVGVGRREEGVGDGCVVAEMKSEEKKKTTAITSWKKKNIIRPVGFVGMTSKS